MLHHALEHRYENTLCMSKEGNHFIDMVDSWVRIFLTHFFFFFFLHQIYTSQGDGWHDNRIVLRRVETNEVVADCTCNLQITRKNYQHRSVILQENHSKISNTGTLPTGYQGECAFVIGESAVDSSTTVSFIISNLDSLLVSENQESLSRGIANGVCTYARNSAILFVEGTWPPRALLACSVPQFVLYDNSSGTLDIEAQIRYSSSEVLSLKWDSDVNLLESYIRDELTSMYPGENFDSMILELTELTNEKSSSSSGLSTAGGIGISVTVVVILIVLVFISYFAYSRGYCSAKHPSVTRRIPSGMVELREDDKSMQAQDSKKIRATDIVPDVEDNTSSNSSMAVDGTPVAVGAAVKVQSTVAM